VNRRDAMGALGAWTLASVDAAAQAARAERPFRVGLVIRPPDERLKLLADSLVALGWVAGKDYVMAHTDIPYGPRIDEAATRIVAKRPDVILVAISAQAVAVRRLTTTTPIVMITSGYPVAAGLAESLARPGLNVTGNTSYAGTGIWGKLFQLLAELKPGLRRVVFPERSRLTELAVAQRLPTISDIRWAPQVRQGPLMSYGAVAIELWRQAAWFVDQILRGAKAGELPIQ
jgi:putative tryptophan/tyrosine transport system substrate-binding protein